MRHIRRLTALFTGFGLVLAGAAVAATGATAANAATGVNAAAGANGKLTVVITAPKGVPANVELAGHRKVVFAKPTGGTSKAVSMRVPAGSYRVLPEATVFGGDLYAAPAHSPVRVLAGRTVKITVRFSRIPSASGLHSTKVTSTSIALAWSAPNGAAFALRRTKGAGPARTRGAGVQVKVKGRAATDTGLQAGQQYSYALFTKLHRRWTGPITVVAGTAAAAGSKTASYTAAPGTMLPPKSEVQAAEPTGTSVQVALTSSVSTPVIGTPVVLPVSASLPGGFVGKVSGVSANGTFTLQPAGLSAAFQYYDINIDSFSSPALPLTPATTANTPGMVRPKESCLGVTSSGTITFSPSLRLGGSFHAQINTSGFLHIPTGASLAMQLTATVTGAMSVETSASVSCEAPFKPVIKLITADPVPISFMFSPDAEVSADAGVEVSNLGATVTGGIAFSGTLGLSRGASFTGSHILSAQPLTPDVTANGSVGLTLGGQVVVGPGAGTADAGAIAGVSGELDPLSASFGAVFPQDADSCLKASAALEMGLGLTAKAWLDGWSIERKISFSALTFTGDYPGSPWYFPDKCEFGPLTVNGGTLPDGQVSNHYDQTLSASGGQTPYEWAVTDGSLPPGVTLSDDGELTGTPVSEGTFQFTVQVTDDDEKTAIGTYSLTIDPVTTSPDAITEYDVGSDLGCAMFASGDDDGEFYGGSACGTFIAVGGQLYGPSEIPAGENLGSYDSWDPVSQTTSGSGTAGDPFVITTTASADGSPITISETDTYAVGGDEVATSMTLTNSSDSPAQLNLYHGFDCFPGDSDTGTGTASSGSVSCVSDNVTADGARTLKLTPLTGGSSYVEEFYGQLWSDIASQGLFSNTVEADDHDTAEGLAWPVTVPANGSVTIQCTTDLLLTQ